MSSKSLVSSHTPQQRSWTVLNDTAGSFFPKLKDQNESQLSLDDVSYQDMHPVQGQTSTPVARQKNMREKIPSPAENILKKTGSKFAAANDKLQHQRILIASDHYFRLVLESYEHLKAAHYRASQEFSLAEWLHVHALLLYGKIQSVQNSMKLGNFGQHNQIDLNGDVLVFDPIATALNAIMAVEDPEVGLVYIPDANFPKANKDTMESALELQQILNGTLYDWQRSWTRVAEARIDRETRETRFATARSSSQLISAIQQATEKVGKARREGKAMASVPDLTEDDIDEQSKDSDSSFNIDISGAESGSSSLSVEEQLHILFEEARNAKDYTIRPPCDSLYSDVYPAIMPVYLQPKKLKHAAASKQKVDSKDQTLSSKIGLITNSEIGTNDGQLESLALQFSTGARSERDGVEDKGKQAIHRDNSERKSQNDRLAPEKHSNTPASVPGSEKSPCSMPRSALRKSPRLRISDVKPYQSIPSPLSFIARGSNETLVASPTSSLTLRGGHAKIQGSGESDQFVQYDSQLWQDYTKFVNALIEPDLASFSPLRSSGKGSYAWMIPVRVQKKGDLQAFHLQLPRKSIPLEDQALALILQTSSASQELFQSWHISMAIQVSLKALLTEYVESAIKARF